MQRAGQFMSAQTQNPAYGQFMVDSAGRVQMGAQGAGLRTGVRRAWRRWA